MSARRIASIMLCALLPISPVSYARQFAEWESKQDFFAANFPGVPTVTDITWETEYGAKVPARVYTAMRPGPRTYSVTVVNYNPVQQILTERAKSCDQGDERCTGDTSFPGAGYWKNDVRGAMIYAAAKYLKRDDLRVTHYGWSFLGTQSPENNELQLVNTKDQSRTYVNIMMHHNMLYIMEETTPANSPPPGLFVQSMSLKESDGTLARHWGVYFNGATIDPDEAKTCSSNIFGNRGRGAGAGRGAGPGSANAPNPGRGATAGTAPNPNPPGYAGPACETLPAAVRFQQGPVLVPAAAQAPNE
jgi:hypothetical protein